jgi:uncharacterized protein DUF3604
MLSFEKIFEREIFLPDTEPDSYQYDLSLHYLRSTAETVATWIERKKNVEQICFAALHDDGFTDIQRIAPCQGAPRRPQFCGDEIFWTEYKDKQGTLYVCKLVQDCQTPPVAILKECDCDGFAVLQLGDGKRLLLVETESRLRFFEDNGSGWKELATPVQSGVSTRPVLCETPDGIVAAWDCYADGAYRICSALFSSEKWKDSGALPAPSDTWETLPTLTVTAQGVIFAARCRERLIELQEGAANFHSTLVVSVLEDDCWRDIADVSIDHALNPWMAAYWGERRKARLASDTDGVWLIWEEKIDINSMDPSLGRLCAVKITRTGAQGNPIVLMKGESNMVLESPLTAAKIIAATKNQPKAFVFQLPYQLHRLSIDEFVKMRPQDLENNTDKPLFSVSHLLGERAKTTEGFSLFFGDPHIHSNLSYDLDPEPDELYHFARDKAKLDFVAFTENDATRFTESLTPADCEYSWRLAERFNCPGSFTAFIGWEYTLHKVPGTPGTYDSHRSVIFPSSFGRMVSRDDVLTPPDLAKEFRGEKVLLHHHHPAGYDLTDDSVECNIEIVSGWWNCMRIPKFVDKLHEILNRGVKLGFIGASDNHERNPGLGGALTGVWAKENTREAIFEAFQKRRVFATTGLRPDLRFSIGNILMGEEGECSYPPKLHIQVSCDVPVCTVDIIRNGEKIHSCRPDSREVDLSWHDEGCPDERNWYYIHVGFTASGKLDWSSPTPLPWNVKPAYGIDAWASPIWIEKITKKRRYKVKI